MNLQTDNICRIYFKYLIPSLFSGLVMSIYSLVDMIVVEQYEGAAIATVAGQTMVFVIQLLHLFSKKNTIGFIKVSSFLKRSMGIASVGMSSFLCSVGMGVLVVLFNNQIMRYFGSNELAVYGGAGNLFTLVQTFSYGIGNAAQPIVAENMGAGKPERVRQTRNLGCYAAAGIGRIIMLATMLVPFQIVRLYMRASTEILAAAPGILRRYFTCLLFVPFNVYATYYLQAVQKVKESLTVSLLHSFLLGAVFVYIFPAVWGGRAIWYVMLLAEMITAVTVVVMLRKQQ